MNAPQPPRRPCSALSHDLSARATLQLIAAHVWLAAWITGQLRHLYVARREDRGEALATAAIAVGLVIIAGIVIAVLKAKGQDIANNVCTNADPSTC